MLEINYLHGERPDEALVVTCCQCEGIAQMFDRKTARRDLRRFRRRGPTRSTRLLTAAIQLEGVRSATLLDIGGGVGAIHHVLLDAGATEAVQVDVSPAYLETAREETARRQHSERVRFVRGDFVELAPNLTPADIVTLDRVICCYPDMPALVGHAAEKARRVVGAVYPRQVWWMRAGFAIGNVLLRVQRSEFRIYLHSPFAIDGELRRHGLQRRTLRRTLFWEIVVYARVAA